MKKMKTENTHLISREEWNKFLQLCIAQARALSFKKFYLYNNGSNDPRNLSVHKYAALTRAGPLSKKTSGWLKSLLQISVGVKLRHQFCDKSDLDIKTI